METNNGQDLNQQTTITDAKEATNVYLLTMSLACLPRIMQIRADA